MRFFFPDSQDLVSPTYDFVNDEYHPLRVRQRDDCYAHEVLDSAPYNGILVSKAIVDGSSKGAGKYSEPQRQRMYRYGVDKFFRLPDGMATLGDCGAFNYVDEAKPPFTVQSVVDFYAGCGFQAGVSVDHIVLGFDAKTSDSDINPQWPARRALTIQLAEEFMATVDAVGRPFQPVGAAQGWSPDSYAQSVAELQAIGYRHIAMGGMVTLKTPEILSVLRRIAPELRPETELHLLGITRVEAMEEFASLGVTSFDSTTPLRQAFMDDRNNYHTHDRAYVAVRVPQVDGNPSLKKAILSGVVSQGEAVRLERLALRSLRAYDSGQASLEETVEALAAYELLVTSGKKSYQNQYTRTLLDRPWEGCGCAICRDLGVEVVIFRGTERNKRRGFHNLQILNQRVSALRLG